MAEVVAERQVVTPGTNRSFYVAEFDPPIAYHKFERIAVGLGEFYDVEYDQSTPELDVRCVAWRSSSLGATKKERETHLLAMLGELAPRVGYELAQNEMTDFAKILPDTPNSTV